MATDHFYLCQCLYFIVIVNKKKSHQLNFKCYPKLTPVIYNISRNCHKLST